MQAIFAALMLGATGLTLGDPIETDRVAVIEVNDCFRYFPDGRPAEHCFRQIIFWVEHWDVGPRGPRVSLRVAAFIMSRSEATLHSDRVSWRDGPTRLVVRAGQVIATTTAIECDPEAVDRKSLAQDSRRGLFGRRYP